MLASSPALRWDYGSREKQSAEVARSARSDGICRWPDGRTDGRPSKTEHEYCALGSDTGRMDGEIKSTSEGHSRRRSSHGFDARRSKYQNASLPTCPLCFRSKAQFRFNCVAAVPRPWIEGKERRGEERVHVVRTICGRGHAVGRSVGQEQLFFGAVSEAIRQRPRFEARIYYTADQPYNLGQCQHGWN